MLSILKTTAKVMNLEDTASNTSPAMARGHKEREILYVMSASVHM